MSRCYRVLVIARMCPLPELKRICDGWGVDLTDNGHGVEEENDCYVAGERILDGGMDEEEAHDELHGKITERFPKAKIVTEWILMSDLPSERFGDLE